MIQSQITKTPANGGPRQASFERTPSADSLSYILLNGENRTPSKSFLSKLKNLGHTLSSPFRALTRGKIENSIGSRNSSIAMMNVKSEQRPATFSKFDYQVVGGKEGYGPRPFIEKIFG
jgi:hypothetical protein